jgi:tRNA-dihydrouridine synthase
LALLRKQFAYVVELRGPDRAIPFFRKMAHWYLKSMQVTARLRNDFQQAKTPDEVETALAEIIAQGPLTGSRHDALPEMSIPVPAGPVEHW